MADNPRIEELKRRVQKDPASIAFAQLAEEHRRAGEYEEAISVCRAGLEQHPGYLSARVTLGRALLETGQYADAQAELEYVLRAAPDNLAAIRALAEIHQRREDGDSGGQTSEVGGRMSDVGGRMSDVGGRMSEVGGRMSEVGEVTLPPIPDQFVSDVPALDAALDLAFRDVLIEGPELPELPEASDIPPPISDLRPPTSDLRPPTSDLRPPTTDLRPPTTDLRPPTSDLRPPTSDPVLTELESWLAAIVAHREQRRPDGAR